MKLKRLRMQGLPYPNSHIPDSGFQISDLEFRTSYLLPHQKREPVDIPQRDTGSFRDHVQRVFHYPERDAYFLGQPFIESPEQGASSREVNAVTHNIRV